MRIFQEKYMLQEVELRATLPSSVHPKPILLVARLWPTDPCTAPNRNEHALLSCVISRLASLQHAKKSAGLKGDFLTSTPRCCYSVRPSKSSDFMTCVIKNSMCFQDSSDWSMSGTNVSGGGGGGGGGEFRTHRLASPRVADEEFVLRIVHRGTAVAIRLLFLFFEALQERVKTTMFWKR